MQKNGLINCETEDGFCEAQKLDITGNYDSHFLQICWSCVASLVMFCDLVPI